MCDRILESVLSNHPFGYLTLSEYDRSRMLKGQMVLYKTDEGIIYLAQCLSDINETNEVILCLENADRVKILACEKNIQLVEESAKFIPFLPYDSHVSTKLIGSAQSKKYPNHFGEKFYTSIVVMNDFTTERKKNIDTHFVYVPDEYQFSENNYTSGIRKWHISVPVTRVVYDEIIYRDLSEYGYRRIKKHNHQIFINIYLLMAYKSIIGGEDVTGSHALEDLWYTGNLSLIRKQAAHCFSMSNCFKSWAYDISLQFERDEELSDLIELVLREFKDTRFPEINTHMQWLFDGFASAFGVDVTTADDMNSSSVMKYIREIRKVKLRRAQSEMMPLSVCTLMCGIGRQIRDIGMKKIAEISGNKVCAKLVYNLLRAGDLIFFREGDGFTIGKVVSLDLRVDRYEQRRLVHCIVVFDIGLDTMCFTDDWENIIIPNYQRLHEAIGDKIASADTDDLFDLLTFEKVSSEED